MKKAKSARKDAGRGESRPVVFKFDNFEVEVAFDQPGEGSAGSGSLKNAWFEATRPKESPGTPPIVNNPG